MESLRTYYWNSRKVDTLRFFKNKILNPENMVFRYGNAGDIFNVDLIEYLYGTRVNNVNDGKRLLLVGSIMNILKEGDIVNGIGWKGNDFSDKQELIEKAIVYGVRGPLTLELFSKYGADLSNLKFQFDPGLLIKEVYNVDLNNSREKNVIFIPHYKDLWEYKDYPKGVKVINIDNKPEVIIKEILKAEVVYASSLHGIIFSHALNKPCVFVAPQTPEPIFKYKDYYASVDIDFPEPLETIHKMNARTDIATVLKKVINEKDFYFPTKAELKTHQILV